MVVLLLFWQCTLINFSQIVQLQLVNSSNDLPFLENLRVCVLFISHEAFWEVEGNHYIEGKNVKTQQSYLSQI